MKFKSRKRERERAKKDTHTQAQAQSGAHNTTPITRKTTTFIYAYMHEYSQRDHNNKLDYKKTLTNINTRHNQRDNNDDDNNNMYICSTLYIHAQYTAHTLAYKEFCVLMRNQQSEQKRKKAKKVEEKKTRSNHTLSQLIYILLAAAVVFVVHHNTHMHTYILLLQRVVACTHSEHLSICRVNKKACNKNPSSDHNLRFIFSFAHSLFSS